MWEGRSREASPYPDPWHDAEVFGTAAITSAAEGLRKHQFLESTAADRIRLKCRVLFGSAPRYRRPPDAVSRSPVTHAESSEARKTATRAISSGCPMRPRGVPPIISFSNSLPMMPAL